MYSRDNYFVGKRLIVFLQKKLVILDCVNPHSEEKHLVIIDVETQLLKNLHLEKQSRKGVFDLVLMMYGYTYHRMLTIVCCIFLFFFK